MTAKTKREPKPTDAERHRRFVEMARLIGASEVPEDFDRAFEKTTANPGRWVKTKIKVGYEGRRRKKKPA